MTRSAQRHTHGVVSPSRLRRWVTLVSVSVLAATSVVLTGGTGTSARAATQTAASPPLVHR